MSIRIRPANLESDSSAVIELLRRHLSPTFDLAGFRWLYLDGPHGTARAWVAIEDSTGQIVGSAAAYPRKMYFNGQEKSGLVLGDFCIDEKYRSLGPSLQLQRACLTALHEPQFEFLYDFPSRSMMAIYKRLGWEQSGELFRWAKPLRAEEKLSQLLHSKRLAKGISVLANALLARRGWRGDRNSCDVQLHEGPCGQEFSQLDEELRKQPGIRTVRSPEYLNWRYLADSRSSYTILAARRAGKLVGYVVCTRDISDACIVDLCSVEEPGTIARLLFMAVKHLRKRGAGVVSLIAGNAHPWSTVFERAGFRRREASPIVVALAGDASISKLEFEQNWRLMRGDRDS